MKKKFLFSGISLTITILLLFWISNSKEIENLQESPSAAQQSPNISSAENGASGIGNETKKLSKNDIITAINNQGTADPETTLNRNGAADSRTNRVAAIEDVNVDELPRGIDRLLKKMRDTRLSVNLRWKAFEDFKKIKPDDFQEEVEKLSPGDPIKRLYNSQAVLQKNAKD